MVIVAGLGAVGMMRRTMTVIGSRTRCVLLDLPGYHHSGPASCAPTIEDIADLVAAWLRDHTTTPVILLGHSTGAQAALRAAVKAPGLVDMLVMAGPTLVPAARRPWGLTRKLARTLIHESVSAGIAVCPDFARAGIRNLLQFARSGMDDRPEQIMPIVSCPVLVITGEHDHLAPPSWAHRLAAMATEGSAVTIAGAHSFPHTMPRTVSDLIRQAAADKSHTGRVVEPAAGRRPLEVNVADVGGAHHPVGVAPPVGEHPEHLLRRRVNRTFGS
ncbi:alpha/beta fold hydrolase [Catellatospora methionotrophica]|uniref:alpha/beta fold hydrolase n=1 Tax=Catellatospora methionotrophica TaxID=121620 RepID=UPI001408D630|nr:alpha/beta hydrolase [Catellatospora methionotrophica]